MKVKTAAAWVVILTFLGLTACGGGGGAAPAAPTLSSIAVTPANPRVRAGTTQQLTATGSFSDGSTQDITASVTWTSSADANASVSNAGGSSGLASAAAIGSSTVTAALGPTTGSTTLTVIGVVSLPKTGQTACFDDTGATTNCAGTGQDGALQSGVAEPSPRFTVDSTGNCVTDNLTGLMWTRNANLPAGSGAASTGVRTWQQALDFANSLQLCGFTDWRLSNRKELRSLMNYNLANNATTLNTLGFTNVQASGYWSSSSYAGSPASAWIVRMYDGYVLAFNKSLSYYVWPVRAGQ